MHLENLKKLFAQQLGQSEPFSPCQRTPRRPLIGEQHFRIFSINQFSDLVSYLEQLSKDSFTENVRYVVTEDNELLLAREGAPGLFIPGHREICNSVRAAGNLHFNADKTAFCKVGHESGDFCLNHSSLAWVIAILLTAKAPLTSVFTLEIKGLTKTNDFVLLEEIELSKEQLFALLPENIGQVLYQSSRPLPRSENVTPPRKRQRAESFFDFLTPMPADISSDTSSHRRSVPF